MDDTVAIATTLFIGVILISYPNFKEMYIFKAGIKKQKHFMSNTSRFSHYCMAILITSQLEFIVFYWWMKLSQRKSLAQCSDL